MLGFIVQARLGSTRLPDKILLPFSGGRTIFDLLLEKLQSFAPQAACVVATSVAPANDALEAICRERGVACFRGSENDVLQRFIDAAHANGVDRIIRVCSDNPFLSRDAIAQLLEAVADTDADYMSFNVGGTPSIKTHYGFWTEYVTLDALERVAGLTDEPLYHEHVTNYIYAHPESFRIGWLDVPKTVLDHAGVLYRCASRDSRENEKTDSKQFKMNRKSTYIVGEIGQNHNGSVEIAKQMVDMVTRPVREEDFSLDLKPMDAVKMTKRDLDEELTASQMNRPYDSPNSFGRTYGEHRAFLELSDEAHFEVFKYAKERGLDFVETLCARGCLSLLKLFTPDRLKVASRDLTNLPLLCALAETKIPIILSTGMAGKKELDDALAVITRYHDQIAILHCVSQYPTHPDNLNLNTILYLKEHYGQYTIGFSDHTIGIAAPVVAVGMGAEIIEKHITLDRHMKGTDQAGSLGPDGVNRMVRDIRICERWMGVKDIYIEPGVASSKVKLERSIATLREMKAGETVRVEDLHMLSPGDGFKWSQLDQVVGKTLKCDIPKNEIIYPDCLQ